MMNTMRKLLRAAMLLLAVLMAACTAPDTWELVSKDNNIRFVLANKKDKGEVNLCYSVYYRDTLQ